MHQHWNSLSAISAVKSGTKYGGDRVVVVKQLNLWVTGFTRLHAFLLTGNKNPLAGKKGGIRKIVMIVMPELRHSAMRLSTAERAELAAALIASLDGEPEDAVEAAWASEIERRVERVRSGEAKGRPWSEVREPLERRQE
jgi:putative addiction module component (TIGR02574 family)